MPNKIINGIPYDTPIAGYKNNSANTLRLWKAEAPESFNFQAFNEGDYLGAVQEKVVRKTSRKCFIRMTSLRRTSASLEQQYFFVSCSLQDMIRLHALEGGDIMRLPEGIAMQLNDTHPSIAVAELIRISSRRACMPWEPAWSIMRQTMLYTNHTLLPEALEKWPLDMFEKSLPRHLRDHPGNQSPFSRDCAHESSE